jgi:asparagine synthase (glutamine-hydrolysing)
MCGIAGKITPGRPADARLIEGMCAALDHRGPDSRGIHIDGDVAIGMSRLRVIDLVGGDQPLFSEDGGVALVLNGEIYNHRELRADLEKRGHRFSSGSDAEVVVHLWEEQESRCVERLRGMFAFAIWDEGRQELFLARDRLGKKPLLYTHEGGDFAFASEIRALLQDPETPRELSLAAIDAYLVNKCVPGDHCAFRAIRKLPPASVLSWSPGSEPRIDRYWRLEYRPKLRLSHGDAVEQLRALITDATRVRLESDVPLGAFLSGGLDSSAVVAAMAMNSHAPVRTFTAAFAEQGFDESEHAATVARRYGTDHHRLEIGALDVSLLPELAWQFGEPFADPAALPGFQLSELTRRHVTVCLGGDGGDETFAGYRSYWQLRSTLPADRIPMQLRRQLADGLLALAGNREGRRPLPRAARLASRLAMPPSRRYADLGRSFTDSDRVRLYGPLLSPLLAEGNPLAHQDRAWNARSGLGGADRCMATDLATYLPDDMLVKVDITSMAHSLEVRAPLLDHRLVEFAAALPEHLKLRGRSGKVLLRDAVRPWLPEVILERPKHGFAVPVGEWLRRDLRRLPEDVLLDPGARARGLFDHRQVRALIDEHHRGLDRADQLWTMINLELWFRCCVDRFPEAASGAPALL